MEIYYTWVLTKDDTLKTKLTLFKGYFSFIISPIKMKKKILNVKDLKWNVR